MSNKMLAIELGIDATNDDLLEQMRRAKKWRETFGREAVVVSFIRGFGDDDRDLWQIVEVRAFCQRLIDQGFISYLEFWPSIAGVPALGAVEIIMIAESKGTPQTAFNEADLERFKHAVCDANEVADALLGPMAGGPP